MMWNRKQKIELEFTTFVNIYQSIKGQTIYSQTISKCHGRDAAISSVLTTSVHQLQNQI